MRVVVAGAGALGLSIAVELARRGASITIVDPAPPDANASGVAAGMLAPAFECVFDNRPEHFERLMAARELWPDFAAGLGVEIERAGAVAVSTDEARVEAWRESLSALGVASRLAPPAELERDGLAPGFGVAQEEDWRLDPRRALNALRAEGSRLGVDARHAAVVAFTPGRAALSDGGIVSADVLVIASGASKSLLDIAPELSALRPIKGHIVTLGAEARRRRVVRFEGGYLCPASDGVLVGATMEAGHDDTVVDAARTGDLIALARRYALDLGDAKATARVGVRASTQGGLPLMSRAAAEGVWLAVGARRNGWLLAPVVARSIARAITGS